MLPDPAGLQFLVRINRHYVCAKLGYVQHHISENMTVRVMVKVDSLDSLDSHTNVTCCSSGMSVSYSYK